MCTGGRKFLQRICIDHIACVSHSMFGAGGRLPHIGKAPEIHSIDFTVKQLSNVLQILDYKRW